MNKEKFLEQKASEMTVSELAEAIKIKSVLRTNEECKRGDRVKVTQFYKNGSYAITDGKEGEFIEIVKNGVFKGECRILIDKSEYIAYKIEKVKPKAEWTDITKECEFKFNPNAESQGFGYVNIHHNNKYIGTCMSHIPIRIELEKIGIEGNLQFKILKKSGG